MDVTLRPATEDDIPALYEHQADAAVAQMAAMPVRDPAAFEAHTRKVLADPAAWLYAVDVDGRVVGSMMSWDAEGHREIGYVVAREHWGRGIATAAIQRYLEIERVRPLVAYVASHNVASQRVLEKNGFARVGTEQQDVEMVIFRLMARRAIQVDTRSTDDPLACWKGPNPWSCRTPTVCSKPRLRRCSSSSTARSRTRTRRRSS